MFDGGILDHMLIKFYQVLQSSKLLQSLIFEKFYSKRTGQKSHKSVLLSIANGHSVLLIIQVIRQQYQMRNQCARRSQMDLDFRQKIIDEFYDPLQLVRPIKSISSKPMNSCLTLFEDNDEDEEGFLVTNFKKTTPKDTEEVEQNAKQDEVLKKIFANSKQGPRHKKKRQNQVIKIIPEYEPFCFNSNIILKYPQTPHFKNQLQSPFWKFNAEHKMHMETLKQKTIKADFQLIQISSDPLNFIGESLRYFAGISLNLKQKECINASRAMMKLGCYAEPFNQRSWKKYIETQEQYGYIYKAFILSKTAFLFTQNEQFAKSYLLNGEKCGVALGQMRGILNSVQNTEIFQKGVLIQIGKQTLKYQQIWKGLKVLYEICQWNDFRLPSCALIIFLARYLQNVGQRDKALAILKRSFGRGMSKLQVYTSYLQIKLRQDEGKLKDSLIKQVLDYIDCISSENRYRLYLDIAELLFQRDDNRYKFYIEQSYLLAKKYCAPGSGCNKTLRHIYYTLLRWKNVCPPPSVPNDTTNFEYNRYHYIVSGKIQDTEFTDWKYYLHYGLSKKSDLLCQASKKWSYTGRLIAEWIHMMRENGNPKEILRIWREKIDQVPKSGQLWCQGGRIFAELHDYENASKCFKAAIHFTPQYGDSFIEQLRIYLIKGQFFEVHKLKKNMLVSEPFYGHVWSFLRQSNNGYTKLSLSEMWDLATSQINESIYRENVVLLRPADKDYRLITAYPPYNEAYLHPNTPQIRQKLFASYEQLDNKN